MPLSVSVPQLVNSSTSTKDQVISVLAYRWPLGAKQIFEEVKRNGGQELTYQAIHKCLTQLEQDLILEKAGKSYQLNQQWISALRKFAEEIDTAYATKNPIKLTENFEGNLTLEFNDFSRFTIYIGDLISRHVLSRGKRQQIVGLLRHAWWPLEFRFQDFLLLRSMVENNDKGYAIIKGNSPLDKWVSRQYLDAGAEEVLLGYDYGSERDFIIHPPSIAEITYTPETIEYLDQIYNDVANISELFKLYMSQKNKPKMHIKLEIRQDEALANLLLKRHVEIVKQQQKTPQLGDLL